MEQSTEQPTEQSREQAREQAKKKQGCLFNLLIGFAVLAIILVIMDNIMITPTKVYTDPQLGFTLRYPAYWSYMVKPEGGALVVFFTPKEEEDLFVENVNITLFDLRQMPRLRTLEEFSQETIRQTMGLFGEYANITESKSIRLGGQPGYRFSVATLQKAAATGKKFRYLYAWTLRGPYAVIITYMGESDDFQANLNDVNRMIRTFKFKKR